MRTLVLVRHGATAWNENHYCQGRKDVGLTARGKEQARKLREAIADLAFDRAFASPLRRSLETVRILGYEPVVLDDLIEIDRGHWEGHAMDEVRRRWGKFCRTWYEDPAGQAMPGGEAFDDLWRRAGRALERLSHGNGDRLVLACGHKALNRALIACALNRPTRGVWDIPQPQACRSVLVHDGHAWKAELVGDVAHLPPDLRSER